MSLSSPYDKLVPWCQLPEHASQSDAERWAALQAETVLRLRPAFGSYRTLCGILSAAEYVAVQSAVTTVAAADKRVADMERMLLLPGDGQGSGGGIDFGHPAVRGVIQTMQAVGLITPEITAKLLSIGEEYVTQVAAWGVTVEIGHLESARRIIEESV